MSSVDAEFVDSWCAIHLANNLFRRTPCAAVRPSPKANPDPPLAIVPAGGFGATATCCTLVEGRIGNGSFCNGLEKTTGAAAGALSCTENKLAAGDETAAGAGAKTAAAGVGSKTEAAGGGEKTAAAGVGAKKAVGVVAPSVPPEVEAPKEKAVLVLAGLCVAPIEPNTKPDFGGFPAIPANAEGAAVVTASVGVLVRLYTNENIYIVKPVGCEHRSWM